MEYVVLFLLIVMISMLGIFNGIVDFVGAIIVYGMAAILIVCYAGALIWFGIVLPPMLIHAFVTDTINYENMNGFAYLLMFAIPAAWVGIVHTINYIKEG